MNPESASFEFDIDAFLAENPDIFMRRPELLDRLHLGDPRSAISLLEKQIERLRTRIEKDQKNQQQLYEVARENEAISDNLDDMFALFISFNNVTEFIDKFPAALGKRFTIDEVSFKSANTQAPVYNHALRRLHHCSAVCDNRWPSEILDFFFTKTIRSAALVPIHTQAKDSILGILALGSENANRYTNDLGVAHLARLGLMAGVCFSRLQGKS